MALHNFIRMEEEKLLPEKRIGYALTTSAQPCPTGYVDADDQSNGAWRQEVSDMSALRNISKLGSNMYTKTAKQMRDNLCDYFNSEQGSVSWQNERAVLLPE